MKNNKNTLIGLLKKYAIFFVLVALILLFSLWSPYFLTVQNLTNIFVQQSYVIIAAVGLSFVMISGGMDLSLGWQMSLVGVTTAVLMKNVGLPVFVSVLLGCGLGLLLGLLNGYASVLLKVHPLIVTLGTMTMFQGLSYIVANQSVILNLPPSYKFLGQGYFFDFIPVSVVMMFIVVGCASFILNKTKIGRSIYAVGSNPEAAHLAGINVTRIKLLVFGNVLEDIKEEFEKQLSDKVQWIGFIPSDDAYNYFFAADLVMFPGQHSVLWEQACACKMPCVFARWPGMEHVDNGGNACFIDDVSVKGIKCCIESLNRTPDYEKMKACAESEMTDIYLYSHIAKKSLECANI